MFQGNTNMAKKRRINLKASLTFKYIKCTRFDYYLHSSMHLFVTEASRRHIDWKALNNMTINILII